MLYVHFEVWLQKFCWQQLTVTYLHVVLILFVTNSDKIVCYYCMYYKLPGGWWFSNMCVCYLCISFRKLAMHNVCLYFDIFSFPFFFSLLLK